MSNTNTNYYEEQAKKIINDLKDCFENNKCQTLENYRKQIFVDKDKNILIQALSNLLSTNNGINDINFSVLLCECAEGNENSQETMQNFIESLIITYNNIYNDVHKNDKKIDGQLKTKLSNIMVKLYRKNQNLNNFNASINNLINAINKEQDFQQLICFLSENQNSDDILYSFCKNCYNYFQDIHAIYIDALPIDNDSISQKYWEDLLIADKKQVLNIIKNIKGTSNNVNNIILQQINNMIHFNNNPVNQIALQQRGANMNNNQFNLNMNRNNQHNRFIQGNNMIVNGNQQANNQIRHNAQNINTNNQFLNINNNRNNQVNPIINVIPGLQSNNQIHNISRNNESQRNDNDFIFNIRGNEAGYGNQFLNSSNSSKSESPKPDNVEYLQDDQCNNLITDLLNRDRIKLQKYVGKYIKHPHRFQKKTNVCWFRRLFCCCFNQNEIELDNVVRKKIKNQAVTIECNSLIAEYMRD